MKRDIIIEQWIPEPIAIEAGREFPDWTDTRWHTFTGPLEQGKQEGKAEIAGPMVAQIHEQLADPVVIDTIGEALGYGCCELHADPDLTGAGIHQCAPDGRLGLHIDFNLHHGDPTLIRAVNVIVFLSEWGIGGIDPGALVLKVGGLDVGISPSPGLLVAWRAEDDIYHGHPEPLPEQAPRRRSIAVYYYRRLRDGEAQPESRSTTFLVE